MFKNIIKKICLLLPIKNTIIMESNPDFTDNTKKLFDKLIEEKVNDTYKIVWLVDESKKFRNIKIKNVIFVDIYKKHSIIKRIKKAYYVYTAKIIVDSNKFISKVRKEQFRLHLCHGTPLKNAGNYCKEIGDVDYILELGTFFRNKNVELFGKDRKYFLDIGFPRNDELFIEYKIEILFPEYEGNKIIVWLPTYRKHMGHSEYKDSSLKYGLPGINSKDDFLKLNNVLKKNNTLLLIKLHPVQDKKEIERFECSNIKIITDEQLIEKDLNLYKLLAISDALITDYSSVYYDYLLTKKPIALAISDFKEYEQNVGFAYNYYDIVKGEYINNTDELCNFIMKLANNVDDKKEERLECMKLYHTFCDNKSSERVYEFIKKYL